MRATQNLEVFHLIYSKNQSNVISNWCGGGSNAINHISLKEWTLLFVILILVALQSSSVSNKIQLGVN
jgi:hypothetical protein